MKAKASLLLAALAFAVVSAQAKPLSGTVSTTYTLTRGGSTLGTGTETYRSDGKNYSITSEAQGEGIYRLLFGNFKRVSRGNVTGEGL